MEILKTGFKGGFRGTLKKFSLYSEWQLGTVRYLKTSTIFFFCRLAANGVQQALSEERRGGQDVSKALSPFVFPKVHPLQI